MSDIKQKAIEHAERAVRNLRRSTDLFYKGAVDTTHARLQDTLALWEAIAIALTVPHDPTVEELHSKVMLMKYESEQLIRQNARLQEDLDNALARIDRYRKDEEERTRMMRAEATVDCATSPESPK